MKRHRSIPNQFDFFPDLAAAAILAGKVAKKIVRPPKVEDELEEFQGQVLDALDNLKSAFEEAVDELRGRLNDQPDTGAIDLACEFLDSELSDAVAAFTTEIGI